MGRLEVCTGRRLFHSESAEKLLKEPHAANIALAKAQVHATLALFYQNEARDFVRVFGDGE